MHMNGKHQKPSRHEAVYAGIDIGKSELTLCLISNSLLKKLKKDKTVRDLSTFTYKQSRGDFDKLLLRLQRQTDLVNCYVLLEATGHYQVPLVEHLLHAGVHVYILYPKKKRDSSEAKTDSIDAQNLALRVYNQLEKEVLEDPNGNRMRRFLPSLAIASELTRMMQYRRELTRLFVQCKNRLTAITDLVFPEFLKVYRKPVTLQALKVRRRFPLPGDIAQATYEQIQAASLELSIPEADLIRLQNFARQTIGTKDAGNLQVALLEQTLLIEQFEFFRRQIAEVDKHIEPTISQSREGKILVSIPGIGNITAAILISTIGNINNFPNRAHLQSYIGWKPVENQSGESSRKAIVYTGGRKIAKSVLYLAALSASRTNSPLAKLYHDRLNVEHKPAELHKGTVIGHIVGRLISIVYALLKHDSEVLKKIPPGAPIPPPQLYNAELHRSHQTGHYRSSRLQAAAESK